MLLYIFEVDIWRKFGVVKFWIFWKTHKFLQIINWLRKFAIGFTLMGRIIRQNCQGGFKYILEKRLSRALFFWRIWISQIHNSCRRNMATVDAHGYVIYRPLFFQPKTAELYNCIGVGFFVACPDRNGNARAWCVGQATGTDSHVFLFVEY